MPTPKLLTCRQMAERIQKRNPHLTVSKYVAWDVAKDKLGLKPAFQLAPTEGQRKEGGATMFFTPAQEKKIEGYLLKRSKPAAVAA
jgi:hypothetical protein